MKFGDKYEIFPSGPMRGFLARTFGCARVTFNWGLALKQAHYAEFDKNLTYTQLSAQFTQFKKTGDKLWLNEVPATALQQELKHLETAFSNFFKKRAKFPRFKAKSNEQSFTLTKNNFQVTENTLKLSNFEEVLPFNPREEFDPNHITSLTIRKTPSNQYWVSFQMENEMPEKYPIDLVKRIKNQSPLKVLAIDMGINSFCTMADEYLSITKLEAPKPLKKQLKKLARASRRLSRRVNSSSNREKARRQLASLHSHIANIRKDFLHKLSTWIADKNHIVIVENLHLKGMMKNRRLARSFADVGMGEFFRMLEYKLKRQGKHFVQVSRWFPSSKQCSDCGHIHKELSLKDRTWVCPKCKTEHDRDGNAAINLLHEGLRLLGLEITEAGNIGLLPVVDTVYPSDGGEVKSVELM